MKTMNSIIITILMCVSTIGYAQYKQNNAIEFTYDFGISNDLGPGETYRTFFSEMLIIDEKTSARTKNIAASYTRYINPRNGIKISFGLSKYGFDYKGVTDINNTKLEGTYLVSYLEWGISYLARIPLLKNTKFLIEPGIRYHSDGSPKSSGIAFYRVDALSVSLFSGLEILMTGDNVFTIVGLQFKHPLQRYNHTFDNTPPNYPYFIGLKIGFKYQF